MMLDGAVVEEPNVTAVLDKLRSGAPFVALADEDTGRRAASLEAVLQDIVDEATRVVWVGNPLRSRLTLERLLLQIVGPEIDLRVERGPAELAEIVTQRVRTESRLLAIVQQPETIGPETLELLAAMAEFLGEKPVQLQFLFVGSPALRLPAAPVTAPATALTTAPPRPVLAQTRQPPEPAEPGLRRRDAVPLLLLLLFVSLGAVFSLSPRPVVPLTPADAVSPSVATFGPPVAATAPLTQIERLRIQFDAFLAQRAPTLPPLSDAQKDALFTEFLTHHRRE
ncbi:MAG: hypothetical protein RQ966_02395 [Acetobacteraceae bacterium]|nr:hypothetical protein [Acetobacteraceae bacterium]